MQDIKQQAANIFRSMGSAKTPRDKSLAFIQLVGFLKQAKTGGKPVMASKPDMPKKPMQGVQKK
jgi:hypothetical protein